MFEALMTFIVTFLTAPLAIKLGLSLRILGVDVHKSWRPIIPKTGGLPLILGTIAGLLLNHVLGGGAFAGVIALSCFIAAIIGFFEDFMEEINPRLKPILLLLPALPILLAGAFTPRPVIPFLGKTRLYNIYPILVLSSYPIVCNAVNSIDVLNGSMALTSIPFFVMSMIIFYVRGDYQLLILSAIFLASLLAFIPYNKYPAKIFPGNSGSLFIGAAITSIAIIGRIEIASIIALLPQIMNEMHIIFSLGGIRSAKKFRVRPLKVEDGLLTASEESDAPITLLRMLCAKARVDERSAVYALMAISIFTSFLGLITDLLFIEGAL
ncbi:MAG: hypothetical protein N3F65_04820 [Nitrososphaeria archaeon]|nr:hypothetical protein [Nitrososphaeria archaeon]MDW8022053.1 hypothetical protein [Nitrososphaerota archaeon]